MSLLLPVLFFASLMYTILGIYRLKDRFKLTLATLLGLLIITITFPITVVLIDSLLGGFIQERGSLLWSMAKFITPGNGDVYIGAGGLLLLIVATLLLAMQMLLVRKYKPLKRQL